MLTMTYNFQTETRIMSESEIHESAHDRFEVRHSVLLLSRQQAI